MGNVPAGEDHEHPMPWAISQAEGFDADECPFCALRRSHCAWLQSENRRLASEVHSLESTVPPRLHPKLREWLASDGFPLPESGYTGGVEEVKGRACPRCQDR